MKKIISASAAIVLALAMPIAHAFIDKQAEINKRNVIEFYNQVINQKDFTAASQYVGSRYIQHNPMLSDGLAGLKAFIQYLRTSYPQAHSEIKKIFAEGDYVFVHVHGIREPGTRGRAIFDLFRLENGKIVEHWDTIQDIPEHSANSNGMF